MSVQRKVSIWDMFSILWAVMSNVLNAIDKMFQMITTLVTVSGEVSETVLETGNNFADMGFEASEGMLKNQAVKIEDEFSAALKNDPKHDERMKAIEKRIADKRNARRSRR